MNTIKNIIENLLNDEKEQLNDLISECKKREAQLDHVKSVLNSNMIKIDEIEKRVSEDFALINENSKNIDESTENSKEKEYLQLLTTLPDDQFFKA